MTVPEDIDPYAVARQLFPDLPPGFPYEGFEPEELILPDGDDMGIRSDDDDVKDEDVPTQSGFASCIGEAALRLSEQLRWLSGRLGTARGAGPAA
jgi:hypothetical protein